MAEKKKAILILALFFAVFLVGKAQGQAVIAQGGNITPMNITAESTTEFWQGIPGRLRIITPTGPTQVNATGGEVNKTDINITSPCKPVSISGFVLFSNSSVPPVGLTAGNLTQLDNFLVRAFSDSGTRTFTKSTTFTIGGATINNVPTTYTNVNCAPQDTVFREGYLNDAAGNIVFAVEIDYNTAGYNSSIFDFQALLAAQNGTWTEYYITTLLNIVCPRKGRAGGGGGYSGGCLLNWTCTEWGPCIDGIQTRQCYPITTCRFNLGVMPALTRTCAPIAAPEKIDELDIVETLKKQAINISAPKRMFAHIGEELTIPVTAYNPNAVSIEQLSMLAETPQLMQEFLPLHTNPKFYQTFNMITLKPIRKQITWTQTAASVFRLNPKQYDRQNVSLLVPIIQLQTVPATIDVYSGEVPLASEKTEIVLETRPFVLAADKRGKTTDVEIVIDNRGKEKRTVEVELNFNKGRSTVFTEIYTLDLPANEVAIYGYRYGTLFDYDHIKAKYDKYTAEV